MKSYMVKHRLSQAELAKRAKVSQSTVCRALDGVPLRRGRARDRLFRLVGIKDPRAKATERVVAAFQKIWDNTDEHARAVVAVINALGTFGNKR